MATSMGNVDSDLSRDERRILGFLLEECRKTYYLPDPRKIKEVLSVEWSEEIETKMVKQFVRRGMLGPGLSESQQKLFNHLLDQFSKHSRVPTLSELEKELGMQRKQLEGDINRLETLGIVGYDPSEDIVHMNAMKRSYDYSVVLDDGKEMEDASCAIDALGIPFMYDRDATIHSRDAYSGEELKISLVDGEVVEQTPDQIWVYFGFDCSTILFFTSRGNIRSWEVDHSDVNGTVLSLREALEIAKGLFEDRLRLDYVPKGLAYDPKNKRVKLLSIPGMA